MRILALVFAFLLISAPSAVAGGWAVTYLDPVPSFEPKSTHTVGYWVMQHGTHPFEGELGETGLKFRSDTFQHIFVGVPLGEPGHYAVSLQLPTGSYEVFGVQGIFRDHPIGTLTVPGTLLIKPVDPQLVAAKPDGPSPLDAIAPPPPAVEPAAAVVPPEKPGRPVRR